MTVAPRWKSEIMRFETELLRLAFFRCLQDWNNCTSECKPGEPCGCEFEMRAYIDEAREAVLERRAETPPTTGT